jgi:hypothetical protein
MADTNEFIRNMLQLYGIRTQMEAAEREAEIADRNSVTNAIATLQGVLRQTTDPNAQGGLIESFIGRYLPEMPVDAFHGLMAGTQPTGETMTVGEARQGLQEMPQELRDRRQREAATVATTGMNEGAAEMSGFQASRLGPLAAPRNDADRSIANMFGNAFLMKSFAGLTPGQFSVDQAVHNLDPQELASAARISSDLLPGASQQLSASIARRGQDLGYAQGMASNRLGWASLAQQGALGIAQLQMQMQEMGARVAGGQRLTPAQGVEVINLIGQLTTDLQKAPNPATRQLYSTAIQNAQQLLGASGLVNVTTGVDPNALTSMMGDPLGPNVRRWNDQAPPFPFVQGQPQVQQPQQMLSPDIIQQFLGSP